MNGVIKLDCHIKSNNLRHNDEYKGAIPAKAGNLSLPRHCDRSAVIHFNTYIYLSSYWLPVFAGMKIDSKDNAICINAFGWITGFSPR